MSEKQKTIYDMEDREVFSSVEYIVGRYNAEIVDSCISYNNGNKIGAVFLRNCKKTVKEDLANDINNYLLGLSDMDGNKFTDIGDKERLVVFHVVRVNNSNFYSGMISNMKSYAKDKIVWLHKGL